MILCQGIERNFGELKVLKGVDLQIKKGEIVSIVGTSGAGKTTLLQLIGTLDKPDAGRIFIHDEDVFRLSGKALGKFRNENIGFVFQFHQLLPEFTAIENVCIPGYIAKKNKTEVQSRAKKLLNDLGLERRCEHKPNQLSGGEQQRVAIARALMNQPSVILADEPSGNLDSKNAKELHELFFWLRDKYQQTFVVVTHNEKLADMADRKLVMADGKIIS